MRNLKKTYWFIVAALVVAFVIPTRQAHAGHIIGIQGGYALQQLGSLSVTSDAPGYIKQSFKRSDFNASALKYYDNQGGFFELNYDYTIGFGKMVYLGFGPYFNWAGVKDMDPDTKDKMTHFIAVGPELVVGFNVIPLLDVTLRSGVGFAYATNPDWDPKAKLGVNWRVIPGVTIKFGMIGVSIEAGYVGNWLTSTQKVEVLGKTYKLNESMVLHGAQVGVGVKLYL